MYLVDVVSTTTLKTGGSPEDWHGRASIKRRADDVLVMSYYSAEAHQTNAGALHIRFSDDNGATWTAEDTTLSGGAVSGFPMNPPDALAGEDAGEPWLYVAPSGALVIHMWRIDYGVSMGGTYQARSTDGGETWSAPAQVDFGGIADDTPVFATDDDFVLAGTIYAGARVYSGGADGVPSQSIFIKSEDDGLTWSKVSTIMDDTEGDVVGEEGGQEVGLEYLGSNTILAMIRDNAQQDSYKRVSTDLGLTWGVLENVTADVGLASRQRIYTAAHLRGEANWWNDPEIIMTGFVHQTPGSQHPRRNAVWISPDQGTTWDGPHYIDVQTQDAGYSDIFYNGSGYSVVSYQGALTDADLKQYDLTITPQFDDDFTGSDGAPWDTDVWTQDAGPGGGSTTIQSNRGRAAASVGNAMSGGRGRGKQNQVPNMEATGSFQLCEVDEPCNGAIWVQTSDDWSGLDWPTDGYGVRLPSDSDQATLLLSSGGVLTQIDTAAWPRDAGLKHFRFRRQNTKVRFRIWDDGQVEPGGWLLSGDDSVLTPDADGGFQIAYTCPTAPSVDACAEFDTLRVGENGDPITESTAFDGNCGFDSGFSTGFAIAEFCVPPTPPADDRIGGVGAIRRSAAAVRRGRRG